MLPGQLNVKYPGKRTTLGVDTEIFDKMEIVVDFKNSLCFFGGLSLRALNLLALGSLLVLLILSQGAGSG